MLSNLYPALQMTNQSLLGSLINAISSSTTCFNVYLLFVKVLVCLLRISLQKNDKMVKPVLLALYSLLVSMVILLNVFK